MISISMISNSGTSIYIMDFYLILIFPHGTATKYNLPTARRQTRMPGRYQCLIFHIYAWNSYSKSNLYTTRLQTRMPERHHLRMGQQPRTQLTHSKPPNPHARKISTIIFASPHGIPTPEAIDTQQAAKPMPETATPNAFLQTTRHQTGILN